MCYPTVQIISNIFVHNLTVSFRNSISFEFFETNKNVGGIPQIKLKCLFVARLIDSSKDTKSSHCVRRRVLRKSFQSKRRTASKNNFYRTFTTRVCSCQINGQLYQPNKHTIKPATNIKTRPTNIHTTIPTKQSYNYFSTTNTTTV